MRALAVVAILIAALLGTHRVATAETLAESVEKNCPNGYTMKAVFTHVDEAEAVHDPDRSKLHKEAARELFRCSVQSSNTFLRQLSLYLYGVEMLLSFETPQDVRDSAYMVAQKMNDLAAVTKDASLHDKALALKADLLKMYAKATGGDAGSTPAPTSS